MSYTNTIEIDEAVVSAVAEKVQESLKSAMPTVATADEIADAIIAKSEKVEKKDIHDGEATVAKTNKFEELSKEARFARGLVAFKANDAAGIAEYNNYVNKAWSEVNKANYQNVTTTADGGALVPDPEFVAEV